VYNQPAAPAAVGREANCFVFARHNCRFGRMRRDHFVVCVFSPPSAEAPGVAIMSNAAASAARSVDFGISLL
jgi:hypothetical protein